MKKIVAFIAVIILTVSAVLFIRNIDNNKSVKAKQGILDLNNYEFKKDGIAKLDGQWELYNNKMLQPEELKNEKLDKYLNIPGSITTQVNGKYQVYMTLHLRVLVPDGAVYGIRIENILSASKVYVNGVLQEQIGRIGKTYDEEKAMYSPVYAYFVPENGVVDIVIQTSNHTDLFPVLRSMKFGLKDQIINFSLLNVGIDFIIIGSLLIIELLFISLFLRMRHKNSFLYFSLLCVLIQLRCLILNERFIVHFFPNMPFELLSKTAALTFYLWVPIYVLFLKSIYKDLSTKIVKLSLVFSGVFTIICLAINNSFYDSLSFLGQGILAIILFFILIFLIKKIKEEKDKKIFITLIAYIVLILTALNDILVNNGEAYSRYGFQIGMFVFAILETYILTLKYSEQITKSEKLKIENQIIYEKSIRDSLTGLHNRNYIEAFLDNTMDKYIFEAKQFSILMLDIDFFKTVNDNYGHLRGDEVLVVISNLITKSVRQTDFVGRYGGEEFIVILPDTEIEKAKEIAERIRTNVEGLSWKEGFNTTLSGGLYENKSDSKIECIKYADDLLYLAKKNGRNKIFTNLEWQV